MTTARLNNWEIIKSAGCHKWWHPKFVDYGVSSPHADTLTQLVNSADFLSQCKSVKAFKGADSLLFPTKEFLDVFVWSCLATTLSRIGGAIEHSSQAEELFGILREQILLEADGYVPGSIVDGTYKTWGFEAYLRHFPVSRCTNRIAKILFEHSPHLDAPVAHGGPSLLATLERTHPELMTHQLSREPKIKMDGLADLIDNACELEIDTEEDLCLMALYSSGLFTLQEIAERLRLLKRTVHYRLGQIGSRVARRVRDGLVTEFGLEDATVAVEELLGRAWGSGGVTGVSRKNFEHLLAGLKDILDARPDEQGPTPNDS